MGRFSQVRKWFKRRLIRRGRFAGSTVVSLVLRPILEKDQVRTWLSAPLMAAAVMVGSSQVANTQSMTETWTSDQPIQTVLSYTMNVPNGSDQATYLVPVQELNGLSQPFHQGHPGIDLMAPLGSNVLSMDNGVVKSIIESPFGYGRHVVIKDDDGTETLYAHLGLIKVAEGDTLKAGNVVGTIGTTGWSTGPHLHFEVRENGVQVNPIKYIGKTLEMVRQGSKLAAAH